MSKGKPFSGNPSVESLSASFLSAIRANNTEAWKRLSHLYGPVVYRWCVRAGVTASDAEDVGQEVFLGVAVGLARFRRDSPQDSFVAWLRTITRYKVADFWRRRNGQPRVIGGSSFQQVMQQVSAFRHGNVTSHDTEPSIESLVISQALKLVQPEFRKNSWLAFWETAIACRSSKDVAKDLGMSDMAVRQAKSRVLRRLREQIDIVC